MKKLTILAVFAVFMCSGASLLSQETKEQPAVKSMKGYLVDQMCAKNMVKKGPEEAMMKAAKHTKSCALDESCEESGYGLISEGKWFKFDDKGNKQAVALLNKTERKNDIMVEVKGNHDGETFNVTSIKEVPDNSKYKPKEEKKSDTKTDSMQ